MRFQTKIILGYAVFVLGVALILGFSYYRYSLKQYETAEENNLMVISEQLVTQMDELFKSMELTIHYILSDSRVLSSMKMLGEAAEIEISQQYQVEADKNIKSGIRTDFIINNFYRTIVFNRTGNAVASTTTVSKKKMSPQDFENMIWIERADTRYGKSVIANDHTDTWGTGSNPQVFSLIKAVQGKNMGYVEVQKKVSDLANLIKLPKKDLEYAIFVNGDELLYTNTPLKNRDVLTEIALKDGEFVSKEYLVSKTISKKFDVTIVLMENMDIVRKNSVFIAPMTFFMAGVFFVISMIFVVIISTFLTKPIRELRKVMEQTKVENIGENVVSSSAFDEIKALNVSYQNVLERLQISMLKEKRTALLQLQAQFDTLQSQVNPHFLFNVLNVIASRGMRNNDEIICEMCGSLASMLRYSTNNKTRYARILEEITYLEQYFYLQKARYEHKINFNIQVSPDILNEIIPKMVLQQVVENCINHAFANMTGDMRIQISGWKENGKWYCKVEDNGQGIEPQTLKLLSRKFEQTKSRILKMGENIELEIGGMGLVNTYARLLLLYNEELIFEVKNKDTGVEVIIGAPMRKE